MDCSLRHIFHNSFDDDQQEVVGTLLTAFKEWCKYCNAGDLFGLMRILKQLGEHEKASEALGMFMSAREGEEVAFFELDQQIFNQQIDDIDLRKAFAKKAVSLRNAPTSRDILINISKTGGWHQSDLEILAKMTEADFYELFKANPGEDHRRVIDSALEFRKYASVPICAAIAGNAQNALKRIGRETRLNRARVGRYSIEVPEETSSERDAVPQNREKWL
jgi:hypothetical protein